MQEQKPVYSHPLEPKKSIPGTQKAISCQPKKRKTKPAGNTKMEAKTKTRLSLTISHLLTLSVLDLGFQERQMS